LEQEKLTDKRDFKKMDRHRIERHERNFRERRNQLAYKHAMAYDVQSSYDHDMDRRPKKRFEVLHSDDESAFTPRKKGHYKPEPECHSERQMLTPGGKSRLKPWENPTFANTSSRRTKRILTPVPAYPRCSDFSGVLSELIPETAQRDRFKDQKEEKPFFSYKSRCQAVDSDGDVLMTDTDSEKVEVENSAWSELDERLRKLEFAKKSWEFEVKEVNAKLNKNLYRLDALENVAESRYKHSRRKQIEGW
jgi:hypothetical protein